MSNSSELIEAGTALAVKAGQTDSFRDPSKWTAFIEQFRAAALLPLPRAHRRLRIPVDVAGRMLAPLATDLLAYARFLLPPSLQALTTEQLASPDISAAADDVVQAWRSTVERVAPSEAASEILAGLEPETWASAVDPGDFDGNVSTSLDEWNVWDHSVQAALASLPDRVAPTERLPLLFGLWAGAGRSPRLPGDWDTAQFWIHAPEHAINSEADLAAARVWALSSVSPLHHDDDRAAVGEFMAWAYRRASTWKTFVSPDPEIHQRLTEEGHGDETGGLWPDWVKTAVSSNKLHKPTTKVTAVHRAPTVEELLEQLDSLTGLEAVKAEIRGIVDLIRLEKSRGEQGLVSTNIGLHMVFKGNPGTGKTTVAALYGDILRAAGALSGGPLIEVTRADLVSPYRGESGQRIRNALDAADGGVLFIDEAYSLTSSGSRDGGAEVVDELVAALESRRGSLVVVVAGYPEPMEGFMSSNPGLASRFRDPVLFPDLSDASLYAALVGLITKADYQLDPAAEPALRSHIAAMPRGEGFGNVREMRKLLDLMRQNLATRYSEDPASVKPDLISVDDVPAVGPADLDEAAFEAGMARIDAMSGLHPVKESLRALANQVRVNQMVAGLGGSSIDLEIGHMVFVGNPGTGKTSVARYLGSVFVALGLLRSGHVHSVGRADLVGEYLGQTAPKVRKAVQKAMDGVLFIDEAYSLTVSDLGEHDTFGREAVNTLVEELDHHRDRLVVAMAGYPEDMKLFLESNQGLASRVRHTIEFPDYSLDELIEIADRMVADRKKLITQEACRLIAERVASRSSKPDFANAREVRNLVDAAITRQAARIVAADTEDQQNKQFLLTIEAVDIPEVAEAPHVGVGFR